MIILLGGKVILIASNPRDKIYTDLIDLAFQVCDEFILVVRNEMFFNQNVESSSLHDWVQT